MQNEIENQNKYRRSIVATKNIEKGQTITLDMLGVKRPGTGLLPREMSKVKKNWTVEIISNIRQPKTNVSKTR